MNTNGKPSIAVVIPLHNADTFIESTLNSLFNQTVPADEIVVVDDASTDDSRLIVERIAKTRPSLKVIFLEKNIGVCATRNIGIRNSNCELICMLDADDLLLHDALQLLSSSLQSSSSYALAFGGVAVIDAKGKILKTLSLFGKIKDPIDPISRGNIIGCGSGVMFRKSDAIVAGLYDEQLRARCNEICGDWDFYLSMCSIGQFIGVKKHIVGYRQHDRMMSSDTDALYHGYKDLVIKISSLLPDKNFREIVCLGAYFRQIIVFSAFANKEWRILYKSLAEMIVFAPVCSAKALARSTLNNFDNRHSENGSNGIEFLKLD